MLCETVIQMYVGKIQSFETPGARVQSPALNASFLGAVLYAMTDPSSCLLTLRLSPKKRPKPKNGCGTVFLGGKTPSNRRRKRATHFGSEPTRDACLRPPSVLLRLHRAESGPLEGDSRSCTRFASRLLETGDFALCDLSPARDPNARMGLVFGLACWRQSNN